MVRVLATPLAPSQCFPPVFGNGGRWRRSLALSGSLQVVGDQMQSYDLRRKVRAMLLSDDYYCGDYYHRG